MLSNVDRRQPRALVQFMGPELITVAPQQLVSVRTMKSMAQPAGTFEVTLKAGASESARNFSPTVEGKASVDEAYWFRVIKPMTLCVIALGTIEEIAGVSKVVGEEMSADPNSGGSSATLRESIKKNVVMLGVVDQVSLDTQVSEKGVMRTVRVVGRDMARLLLDDVLRRYINTTEDTMISAVGRDLILDSPAGRQLWARAHIRATEYGDAVSWFPLTRALTEGASVDFRLDSFFENVLRAAPSLQLVFPNGKRAADYLKRVDLDPSLSNMTTVMQSLMRILFAQGAPWQVIQDLTPRPMIECFVDTVGLEAVLVVRRPPFARPQAMPGFDELALQLAKQSNTSTENVRGLLSPDEAGMPRTDQMTSAPQRVSSAGYHTIPSRDVMFSSLSRSVVDSFAMYQAMDINASMPGNEMQATLSAIMYDLPAAARFGTSMLQIMLPYGRLRTASPNVAPMSAAQADAGVAAANAFEAAAQDFRGTPYMPLDTRYGVTANRAINVIEAVRAYFFFRDNPEYLSGLCIVRGMPEVRIGDRVRLPDHGDLILYVEAVEHTYQFGMPYTTKLALSRGQPFVLTSRLGTWDTDPPLLSTAESLQTQNTAAAAPAAVPAGGQLFRGGVGVTEEF